MARFLVRRLVVMVPTVVAISMVSFLVIQLPPGDFLTTVVSSLAAQGETVDQADLAALRERYALDRPVAVQYWTWFSGVVLRGDLGQSLLYGESVGHLIVERLPLTLALGLSALLLAWLFALPAGVYSAVRKYGIGDYALTTFAFLGVAIPAFLLALVAAFVQFRYFGSAVGGLFSPEYVGAAWNLGKVLDLLSHLWLPIVVLAVAGVAGTLRVLRANLLDELRKPYVVTARSRGLTERRLIMRYPVRVALNPFIATAGWLLPGVFDGEVLVSTVLGLETTGPLLLEALQSQDMYLAGGIIFIISVLTVVGTLISDILLAVVDPRVRAGLG